MKVLVIDDEKLIRWSFEKHLGARGYKVFSAETGEQGIEIFKNEIPDVIFIDNKLPNIQGIEVVKKIRAIDGDCVIVFMTAYGSIDTAVKAMKSGASEYINKPFSNKEIDLILERIKEKARRFAELNILQKKQKEDITFDQIIGNSTAIKKVIQLSKKIAKTEATTILLLGESGTGKDIFARAIHNCSTRNHKSFVTINCSSLPETLLESELFGYEKGAFTDAQKLKKGLFEIAEGGTVFLDEIGEISPAMQVKLLNVLENRQVRRLGGTVDIPVNIRIIAATNQNLEKAIAEKKFRNDLYYRLKVFQIDLPPLRERIDDILLLADYFIKEFNILFQKKIKYIDNEAKKIFQQYTWPGNVRELKNVIERAVILENNGSLHIESMPQEILALLPGVQKQKEKSFQDKVLNNTDFSLPDEGISLIQLEKQLLKQALLKAKNNQTKAAKLLGISRDTLRYKKKKHNL
ncbi:MAG: sigma-54-dependent Fis family transcriptional regulator [Chlorobi bacterium]|nr:sigma-54-dependent Fis family transcriptional regulator [Chlorobiota bacterium]